MLEDEASLLPCWLPLAFFSDVFFSLSGEENGDFQVLENTIYSVFYTQKPWLVRKSKRGKGKEVTIYGASNHTLPALRGEHYHPRCREGRVEEMALYHRPGVGIR